MTNAEAADLHPDLAAEVRAARDQQRERIQHPDPRDPNFPDESEG